MKIFDGETTEFYQELAQFPWQDFSGPRFSVPIEVTGMARERSLIRCAARASRPFRNARSRDVDVCVEVSFERSYATGEFHFWGQQAVRALAHKEFFFPVLKALETMIVRDEDERSLRCALLIENPKWRIIRLTCFLGREDKLRQYALHEIEAAFTISGDRQPTDESAFIKATALYLKQCFEVQKPVAA